MQTGIPVATDVPVTVVSLRRMQVEVAKIGKLCASGRIQTCDIHSLQAITSALLAEIVGPLQLSLFADKQIRR